MKRFVIEREIPGVGDMSSHELCGVARASNGAIESLIPNIQWEHSYIADNKTYCIYRAESEETLVRHAELSGFPIHKISLIETIIDPLTANWEFEAKE